LEAENLGLYYTRKLAADRKLWNLKKKMACGYDGRESL